ncbi:alpha/beta hydrolase [Saccharopolyspora taberi]|uniref:Alpha/beta hydrolase n=1 Tax=Saccharopolyspora taberi TaxID=60895 RepID=A0ABN3VIN7_9PSEU
MRFSTSGSAEPALRIMPGSGARTLVLVLHGGRITSSEPARTHHLAYQRMLPIARGVRRRTGSEVWLLRNRFRGWNAPDLHPVADARWALAEAARRHPGARIVVVGHSLGGRVALRVADADGVAGVCALAPWTEADDPVDQLAGRAVLIVHGDNDRITSPAASADYADRAGARLEVVRGSGHAMLRHRRTWDRLVHRFVADLVAEEERR